MTQVNLSVKALIVKDDYYLALHKCNNTSDSFDLLGGKIKDNENTEKTLHREVEEDDVILSSKQDYYEWLPLDTSSASKITNFSFKLKHNLVLFPTFSHIL